MGWRGARQYFSVRMPAEGTNMEPIGELRAPHPWENLIFHREGRTVTLRGGGCLPTLLYRLLNFVKGKAETRGTGVQTTSVYLTALPVESRVVATISKNLNLPNSLGHLKKEKWQIQSCFFIVEEFLKFEVGKNQLQMYVRRFLVWSYVQYFLSMLKTNQNVIPLLRLFIKIFCLTIYIYIHVYIHMLNKIAPAQTGK